MTAFTWAAFLALAEALAERSTDEAALRTAVSRAYYAAFHQAREAMDRGGQPPHRHGSDHGRIAAWVTAADEPCGLQLRRLRQLRNAADYDVRWVENQEEETRQALDLARRVLRCIGRLDGHG